MILDNKVQGKTFVLEANSISNPFWGCSYKARASRFLGQKWKLKEKGLVSKAMKWSEDPIDTTSCFFMTGHLCHCFIIDASGVKQ